MNMNTSRYELKPWYWVVSYFRVKDDLKFVYTDHGLIFARHCDEADEILYKNFDDDDKVIMEINIKQIEINNGYGVIGNIKPNFKAESNNRMRLMVDKPEDVVWNLWEGWRGNHDQRIEDAVCSKCGYKHPTVKGSLSELGTVCPSCKSIITEVEYSNKQREYVLEIGRK